MLELKYKSKLNFNKTSIIPNPRYRIAESKEILIYF
jgi:hypothetical protein